MKSYPFLGSFIAALALMLGAVMRGLNVSTVLGAKSNPIEATGGNALELTGKVVRSEAQSATLGGAVADLLDKSVAGLKVIVRLASRRVVAVPAATPNADVIDGQAVLISTITRDDQTKKTSPQTQAAEAGLGENPLVAEINMALGAAKPAKSLSALLSAIEDANSKLQAPIPNLLIVVDQTGAGSVKILQGDINPAGVNAVAVGDVTQAADAGPEEVAPLAFE